jgi:Na+-translocating ferredoxin:NAD+ oxidoreductase RnfG subunit
VGITGIVAIISVFAIAPAIVFSFIYKVTKNKHELKKMQYQKQILELEVEKQNNQIKLLEEENKKLDKIIYDT